MYCGNELEKFNGQYLKTVEISPIRILLVFFLTEYWTLNEPKSKPEALAHEHLELPRKHFE